MATGPSGCVEFRNKRLSKDRVTKKDPETRIVHASGQRRMSRLGEDVAAI
ncbi:hypothetical protein B932_0877 [Gluconobacter oxydans H24]|nr:hypothetical protein B932_0877 [Gluconobacter oxydans H24]